MGERITMTDDVNEAYEEVEVELWGSVYKTRDLPKSLQEKADAALDEAEKAKTRDEEVHAFGALFDIWLVPVDKTNKVKPSALLVEKWEADKLTVPQVEALATRIVEESRPT